MPRVKKGVTGYKVTPGIGVEVSDTSLLNLGISLDTETTGVDLFHGAKPFIVSTADLSGNNLYWEWDVDPRTREVDVKAEDVKEIQDTIDNALILFLQNSKFDYKALKTVGIENWPWERVRDTLLAGHMLSSNTPHDLTSMVLVRLGINIAKYEEAVQDATNHARRIARSKLKDWRIAKKGLPEMPSVKGESKKKTSRGGESESPWKNDMWLPRAFVRLEPELLPEVEDVWKQGDNPEKHPWATVAVEYGNTDTVVTGPLYLAQNEEVQERNLYKILDKRHELLAVVADIEERGVTISETRTRELIEEYREESERLGRICTNIAKTYNYDLVLPKSGNNNSLKFFLFGRPIVDEETKEVVGRETFLDLPVVATSAKTGEPSLDANTMEEYLATLPPRSNKYLFIKSLASKRKRDTALSYLEGYSRFWLPVEGEETWYRLHPSLNSTGTDTLRFSSSNPNEQNISKKEGFNLRYAFGPSPGREWWSCDAKNIELRLPAYEAGEEIQIALFERPDEPPFYGSNHLLAFSILHPELWAEHGAEVKKLYADTYYQWTKNGNFAVQYGAMRESGTADRAYHVKGGQALIESRFTKVSALNKRMIATANEFGFVETIPDKSVDPERGYPLMCSRTKWGNVKPTVPLNYHIQGSAMWWMCKAMIRCSKVLREHNSNRKLEKRAYIVMQVHDEIVFDLPKSRVDPRELKERRGFKYLGTNLPLIKKLMKEMEKGGRDFGIPTPVSCEFHPNNWSEGFSIEIE